MAKIGNYDPSIGYLPMQKMLTQSHDENGHLLCAARSCQKPIIHGDFFVEVHQYDQVDTNLRLAVHVCCLEYFADRNRRRLFGA